jgi:hypothetical protein
VVKGEDLQLSGCGFESRRRILDGVSVTLKKEIKVAKWGTPKKYFKKTKKNRVGKLGVVAGLVDDVRIVKYPQNL